MRRVQVAGTGSCVPERVVTNHDLARHLDTTDEWIRSRTGISERRICAPGESASDLGAVAAKRALERAGMAPEQIDCIIVATVTPDHVFPSTAAFIQRHLGCSRAAGFDLSAACSGFVYGLAVAEQLIAGGLFDTVLLVGTEVMSTITDPDDRNTCILFGDGAGACVLRLCPEEETSGLLHRVLRIDCDEKALIVPAGGSRLPASEKTIENRQHFMRMQGRATFRFAVRRFRELFNNCLEETGIDPGDLRWIIPHQVNRRILEAVSKRTGFPLERIGSNLDRYGNTSAAGIPLCLDELVRDGEVERGDLLLFVAFGAGLTWASALLRW